MKSKYTPHLLAVLILGWTGASHALEGEFITIIGPGGLPLNVPNPEANKKRIAKNKTAELPSVQSAPIEATSLAAPVQRSTTQTTQSNELNQQQNKVPTNNQQVIVPVSDLNAVPENVQKTQDIATFQKRPEFQGIASKDSKILPSTAKTEQKRSPVLESNSTKTLNLVMPATTIPANKTNLDNTTSSTKAVKQPPSKHQTQKQSEPVKTLAQPVQSKNTVTNSENQPRLPYEEIDGEKYYDVEYLESKQFNLENKKRFYQIPNTGGGTNWDVVEREKGIDVTKFDPRPAQVKKETIVLGANYTRINKAQLAQVLPMQCLNEKVRKKAKKMGQDDDVSIFPRASFNQDFDFELVDIDKDIQNFRLTSYASQQKNPVYYWPIVIFLDDKGCVLEGVSAFFNRAYPATVLQNASIEGVLHVPEKSRYVMLSPLEEAVDIPDIKLSNQGQIKLKVLR